MEVRKQIISFCLLILSASTVFSQETEEFKRAGLLRAQATISTGMMNNLNNIYIHGNLEYYPQDKLSIRSDAYVFLNSLDNANMFDFKHSSFTGISYHFTKTNKQFDPYITFQPGVALLRPVIYNPLSTVDPVMWIEETGFAVLYSSAVGFNYYAKRFFHFFVEARYVYGNYVSSMSGSHNLNELNLSFGLGFNLRVKKNKTITLNNASEKP